jgi:predicted RNA-binding Zn ribbon-like protein
VPAGASRTVSRAASPASAGYRVRAPGDAREALGRLAREAAGHLAGPAAATLNTCADAVCGMLFLDPGGRRRWCLAEICGVRNRVRAHRRRTRTAAPPTATGAQ